ncbi:MlaE family lipid ABC transporter permease subunit [Helicobacter anatolicus]|uniref:MlaE family lipid ABC transporter permease subunit n=1 Tax=Helicobacter anatolicus TaxID=2905874 RepID=UPI001E569ECE|nr:MlaE family lipid ABC transporter permease subunit [Helicobacter anatolicus]MCE3040118.1 MlaE family lipid ABC transporter permease subunit [Helicobacter anatolicus]
MGLQASFEIMHQKDATIVFIKGVWDFTLPKSLLQDFKNMAQKYPKIVLDFSQTTKLDFNATTFIFLNANILSYQNANKSIQSHIKALNNFYDSTHQPIPKPYGIFAIFGKRICNFLRDIKEFTNFFGLMLFHIYLCILNPKRFRFQSFCYHLNESGFKALPVSLLTSFIVGGAITLQGAIQLQSMGAPLLSIDTTAKLSLREMGPFVLALVIAGRSASSYTAQIGVMNITEESNAMRVMNLNLIDFLVIPRFLALVVVMPLMVFLADIASIFAGMLAIKAHLGISFLQYIERFYETVGWNNFLVGIIKAPFFGAAVALVGTFRGLQVYGDTEQVGKATTISVVNALFWIIFINAIFSIVFTRLDL